MGIQGKYLNIIKAIYIKPTANIPLSVEKQKALALRSGPREGSTLSPFLFHIIMEVLAMEIIEETKMKGIRIGKEEVKLSLFAG